MPHHSPLARRAQPRLLPRRHSCPEIICRALQTAGDRRYDELDEDSKIISPIKREDSEGEWLVVGRTPLHATVVIKDVPVAAHLTPSCQQELVQRVERDILRQRAVRQVDPHEVMVVLELASQVVTARATAWCTGSGSSLLLQIALERALSRALVRHSLTAPSPAATHTAGMSKKGAWWPLRLALRLRAPGRTRATASDGRVVTDEACQTSASSSGRSGGDARIGSWRSRRNIFRRE